MNNMDRVLKEANILIERYPVLALQYDKIVNMVSTIVKSYENGGKLLVCGNGGSAADSLHIVGELMKGFKLQRKVRGELIEAFNKYCEHSDYLLNNLQMGLPAIALVSETALTTAFSNDNAADLIFAQQVLGYGRAGDILLGISTSGNSANIVYAAEVAHALGMNVISLTGETGGKLLLKSDICIDVQESETYKVQELHLPIYHMLCSALEQYFFGE